VILVLSIGEWVGVITLVLSILGLLSAGVAYIVRLEGKTNALTEKVQGVEEKVDRVLDQLISIIASIAHPGSVTSSQADPLPRSGTRPAKSRKRATQRALSGSPPILAAGRGRNPSRPA